MTIESSTPIDVGALHGETKGEKEGRVKVLLYGRLTDAIGRHIELGAVEGCSVAQLRGRLAAAYPAASESLQRSRAVIADRLVGDEHVPAAGEDVEFLPPVSGG